MKRRLRIACFLFLFAPAAGHAQHDSLSSEGEPQVKKDIELPYAFYSDLFGATAAFIYARDGFAQKQSHLIATAMVGTAGSAMLFLRAQDLLVPGFERLFADPVLSVAYFHGDYVYLSGNPRYPGRQAGTNGSAYGNYLTGNGWDNYLRVAFRYLLPVGWGRDHVVSDYRLQRGLLVSGATGGESLNPLASGRTFLELRPFYRSLDLSSTEGVKQSQKTNGIDLSLIWDNRDFATNPSVGQSLTLRWSRDFGWGDSTNPWTVVAGELDQYFSLGRSDWFRQRVIALDLWTADSPTWEYRSDGTVANRSPTFAGAHLGGWWRMRGYRFARFSDKAALYYAAEYRMIPRWNPLAGSGWLREQLGVDWIQLVPFAELGRVAPSWNVRELHTSMKWDVGFGLRALAKGLLVRVDLAGSPEGATVQMMVGQPFQF
jgi:hypothetical protein